MRYIITILFISLSLLLSAAGKSRIAKDNFGFAQEQLRVAFASIDSARKVAMERGGSAINNVQPRSVNSKGGLVLVRPRDWTSGFFPGTLWYMYEHTRNDYWRAQAEKFAELLDSQQNTPLTTSL